MSPACGLSPATFERSNLKLWLQELQRLFFLREPGGTGKTFVYNIALAAVRSRGLIALAAASCGLAALLLQGGRTAHSRFAIPIPIHESSVCRCAHLYLLLPFRS